MLFDFEMKPWLDGFLSSFNGCEKDYKQEWNWFRWQVGGKLFAACCKPGAEHGGYAGKNLLTLKCDSVTAEFMRQQYKDILPGFYMNKQNWVSIDIGGDVPDEVIKKLCSDSYNLIFSKLTKKLQSGIINSIKTDN